MPLRATYHIAATAATIDQRAFALAVEQTIEFPYDAIDSSFIREHIVGSVASITEIAPEMFRVQIHYADEIVQPSVAQFLTVLFGNASLFPDVTLVDFDITPSLTSLFPGPQWGIAKLRQWLRISERALSCAVLKPMGLSTEELLQRLWLFLEHGIDIIKEDHGLNDFSFSPFADRVRRCQEAVQNYCERTGRQVLYCPTLNAPPALLTQQLEWCQQHGIRGALLIPAIIGFPTFAELAHRFGLLLIAHPAFTGTLQWSPASLLGKLFRLLGADIAIFPHSGGRFHWSTDTVQQITHFLRHPYYHFPAAFPAPAGGITLQMLETAFQLYGTDTIFMIGGDLFRHPSPAHAIAQFVETIHRLSDTQTAEQA